MNDTLERLFRPKSIAVIGGGFWCENVISQCQKMGFAGEILPVHPKRAEICGVPAYSSVTDLPFAPDASFIGVNNKATIDVVRHLSAIGSGGAVCFAAGFAEAVGELSEGGSLQASLLQAAGGMPILGPNCYGFINYLDGALLWPDQHGGRACERGVAIITQSSNIAINMTMQARGLPVSYMVTAGNQAMVDVTDIGRALLADERVTALGLHIEGINNLEGMRALARLAHELGKPIVLLKVGRSQAAQDAAMSHTASLSGSDAGADALFNRLGMSRANSIAEFLETLKIFHLFGRLASGQIGSMSCSGGEASLMADLGEAQGLTFPELTQTQSLALRAALGPRVKLANPLDYHTYIWPDPDKMAATFTALMQSDLSLGVVVLDFPRRDRADDSDWANVIEAIAKTQEQTGKPMAVLASLTETLPEHWADDLIAQNILPLCGMSEGLAAIALASRQIVPDFAPILLPPSAHKTTLLDEHSAKARLAEFGVDVPNGARASDIEEVLSKAENLTKPLAIKCLGVAHKTEANAVTLNLSSEPEIRAAVGAMAQGPYLVEEMVNAPVAELLVGITPDPAHGAVLTIGAGGAMTEILRDTQQLLVPARRNDIEQAIQKLRLAPLLSGYRGAEAANQVAIVDAIMNIQACYVAGSGDIIEAEVNPLIVTGSGAIAADALITLKDDQ